MVSSLFSVFFPMSTEWKFESETIQKPICSSLKERLTNLDSDFLLTSMARSSRPAEIYDTKPSFARLVLKTTEWKNWHTIGSYEWVSIKWSVTWKNLKFNTRKEWSKIQRKTKNLFEVSTTNASFSSNYLTMKFVQYFQKLRSCWKGYGQSWQEGIKHLNSCNRKVFIKLYKTYQLVTRIRIPQHSTSHIHGHNSLHHLGIWEPGGKNRPQFLSSTELYNLLYCLPFFLPLERCNLVYQQLCLILPFHPTRQFFKVYKVS